MIGNLFFLSMMLGKENFGNGHCFQYQLCIDDWQKLGHIKGQCWTTETIKQQVILFPSQTGWARMGIREAPYFEIPVRRYIWPVLHILIGVGNAILDYLIDFIENEIQPIPSKKLWMQRELHELETAHKQLQQLRDHWDSNNHGSGIELLKEHREELWKCEQKLEKWNMRIIMSARSVQI